MKHREVTVSSRRLPLGNRNGFLARRRNIDLLRWHFSFLLSKALSQCVIPALLLVALSIQTSRAAAEFNVLIIHSYHHEYPWTKRLIEGIEQGFSDSPTRLFHEFLDAKRYPTSNYDDIFFSYLQTKYSNKVLDLIMVTDDPALGSLLNHRDVIGAQLPIVFLGINSKSQRVQKAKRISGVFEIRDMAGTVVEAARQSKSRQVIVVNETTETGIANQALLDTQLARFGICARNCFC